MTVIFREMLALARAHNLPKDMVLDLFESYHRMGYSEIDAAVKALAVTAVLSEQPLFDNPEKASN